MRLGRKILLGIGALSLLLLGTTWNAAFEAVPAGTDLASDLDTFINVFKAEVRKRVAVEHIFGNGTDDNGLHQPGSARCFLQNAAPTDIAGPGQFNSTADAYAGTTLSTDETGATTRDIGAGRCWIDLDGPDGISGNADDESFAVWNETSNSWVYLVRNFNHGSLEAPYNQLVNGGFEITDGTGSTASTTTPFGWTNLNTSTIAYANPVAVSEGEGTSLITTAAGGADEGVSQTLSNLKASTQYLVQVRVKPTAGDTCDLQVTGGASTVTATSTGAGGSFETLRVFPTTTAVPAALVVRLESNTNTDVCEWDHATLYELQTAGVPMAQDSAPACRQTNTTSTDDFYNDHSTGSVAFVDSGLTCTINVPGPGYMIRVDALLMGESDVNNAGLEARLRENCNGGGATTAAMNIGTSPNTTGFGSDGIGVPISYIKTSTSAGDQCVYTLEGIGHGDTIGRNRGGGDGGNSDTVETPTTVLQAQLVPMR